MRSEKILIKLLRDLVNLLSDEAASNPNFAARLDDVLRGLLPSKAEKLAKHRSPSPKELPDIHREWNQRGETEFFFWLRDQPIALLRGIVRAHDFDPNHRTSKWKESEKLAKFITDRLCARMARGSSFMDRGNTK